jgi:hypothetical protein
MESEARVGLMRNRTATIARSFLRMAERIGVERSASSTESEVVVEFEAD